MSASEAAISVQGISLRGNVLPTTIADPLPTGIEEECDDGNEMVVTVQADGTLDGVFE